MGTTGIPQSMADTKKMLLKEFSYTNEKCVSEVLKSRSGKGGMWIFRKIVSKEFGEYFTVDFIKMEHEKGWTYYKEMNYEIHPFYYDCPVSWLDSLKPTSETGIEWIEKVKKIQSIVLKSGMKIKFNKMEYELLYELSATFWVVRREDLKVFKLSKENIIHSILEGN